jgi:hypothetical protein
MSGVIIRAINNDLNAKTKSIKDHEILIRGSGKAEVSVNRFRYATTWRKRLVTIGLGKWLESVAAMLWLSLQRSIARYTWMTLSINTFC